jgi:hypothetical protein
MKPQIGDVIRLNTGEHWANGLLLIIEEVHSWGVIGMIPTPTGDAPLRVRNEEIISVWRPVPAS